jgi:GDP-4-dehydro-6-deoxy-D-mannose reductase
MQYVRQHGMDVRFTRSFNHTGPGQSERFVCSDWTRQAALIALGKSEPRILVGDIAPAIDLSDVRDVVRAYALILEKGEKGEAYNVCSGSAVPLGRLLELITGKAGKKIIIEKDPARIKKHRTSAKAEGDFSKLFRATGWEPAIPLIKTIDDLYDSWIETLSHKA